MRLYRDTLFYSRDSYCPIVRFWQILAYCPSHTPVGVPNILCRVDDDVPGTRGQLSDSGKRSRWGGGPARASAMRVNQSEQLLPVTESQRDIATLRGSSEEERGEGVRGFTGRRGEARAAAAGSRLLQVQVAACCRAPSREGEGGREGFE
eukprot:209669-Rhodomonas_salina.1